MSTHLSFYLLLLLLVVLSALCPPAHSASYGGKVQPTFTSVELFKTKTPINNIIKPNNGEGDGKDNITPSAFSLPFIVATDDVMIALAGVGRSDDEDDDTDQIHIDILTKYITTKGGSDWLKEVTNGAGWQTQFAFQETVEGENPLNSFAVAANEKKIYILLLNETEHNGSDPNCGIKFVEGTVSGNEKTNGMTIKWETKKSNSLLTEELKKCLNEVQSSNYLSARSIYLKEKQQIVFIVHGTGNNNKNKYVFASVDDKTTEEVGVKLSYVGKTESICLFAFFSWGDKIMMIPTHCGENSETKLIVNESNNMSKMLTDSVGPFGRLLNFIQDKNDFTTTKINNISVLLFTQQKPKTTEVDGPPNKYDVHVWFTDGNRVSSAGRIVTDDNITSSNLLHTKGELFALHQNIKVGTPENVTLTRMEDQLKNIKTVLTAWKNSDNIVRELFKKTLTAPSETIGITDGFVGFLSNRSENNNWIDEYYYVNATVNEKTKNNNGGFTFNGKGAGAKWPVGKQKGEQPYNFTDPGFTLVAAVTVDNVSHEKDNSVFGVSYIENSLVEKRVGLWCTTEGKWRVKSEKKMSRPGSAKPSSETVINGDMCVKGKTYLVALLLNGGKFSVHVNGEKVGTASKDFLIDKTTTNITHFYFGADNSQIDGVSKGPLSVGQTAQYNSQQNDEESHVTVRNVLLYNRPFSDGEIKVLTPKKSYAGQAGEDTSLLRPENSTVRGFVVGVLLSLLLGMCVPAFIFNFIFCW